MNSSKVDQIEKVNSIIKTVLTTIAIFLTGYIQNSFTTSNAKDKALVLLVSGASLLLVVEGGSKIMEYFIDNNSFIRKVILRENFFEGYWIDKTELNTYAIIHIKYEKGDYFINAKSFNQNGELMESWDSVSSWISDEKLECYYEGNYYHQEGSFKGKNEFSFSSSNSHIPCWFTGNYTDLAKEFRKFQFVGERINKEDAKKLQSLSAIPQFINEWSENNKGLLTDRKPNV